MNRIDGRSFDDPRDIKIERDYLVHPDGSVLISFGKTKLICTAMIEERVPFFLKNQNKGWITAEYSMLPGATNIRKLRDSTRGKIDGRTQEIQRLIGRSLRSVVDLDKIGERTIWIDCDVIQADGGTRTAAITGAYVAMFHALYKLYENKKIKEFPITGILSAVSVGIVDGQAMLDLCYEEDSRADVDMNIIMLDSGEYVELQGTGENNSFSRSELNNLLDLGEKGIKDIVQIQREALADLIDKLEKEGR